MARQGRQRQAVNKRRGGRQRRRKMGRADRKTEEKKEGRQQGGGTVGCCRGKSTRTRHTTLFSLRSRLTLLALCRFDLLPATYHCLSACKQHACTAACSPSLVPSSCHMPHPASCLAFLCHAITPAVIPTSALFFSHLPHSTWRRWKGRGHCAGWEALCLPPTTPAA